MSYTMTVEEPEKVALLKRVSRGLSSIEMGDLFVAFLAQREGCLKHQMQWEALPLVTRKLAGVAKDVGLDGDDHGILARAMLEKYERISR